MSSSELNNLILSNLGDLVGAAKHADQLHHQIWTHIAQEASETARALGWEVIDAHHQFIAAPAEWIAEGEATASFYLDKGPEDGGNGDIGEPLLWLSRYLGTAGEQLCLWLDRGKAQDNRLKFMEPSMAETIASHRAMVGNSGNIFISCSLHTPAVIDALETGDFRTALEPIRQALQQANRLKPVFRQLLGIREN